MFTKTVLAAAALATVIAVAPVTSANATDIDFGFSIDTPHGSISFGDGDYDAPDYSMSCWEAKDYLKSYFHKVKKIECNGDIYTFKVRENGWSPWQIVKIDSDDGDYWFV